MRSLSTLILFLLFTSVSLYAQNLLAITYKSSTTTYADSSLKVRDKTSTSEKNSKQLASVSSGKASFVFFAPNSKALGHDRFKKIMGTKIVHHALYFDYDKSSQWDEIVGPDNTSYIMRRQDDTASWKIFDTHKNILGYPCQMALQVSAKNDSTLIWFTKELTEFKSRLFYVGAPGTVLTAEYQDENTIFKYEAIDIYQYVGKLKFPKNAMELPNQGLYQPGPSRGRIFKTTRVRKL